LKVKFHFIAVIGIAFVLALPLAGNGWAGDSLVQELPSGCIDWSAGTVRARGVGAPLNHDEDRSPEAAAKTLGDARKMAHINLLATVNAIRINSASRVADRIAGNGDFRDGVTTLARNAAITRQEYLSDGTVEIELTMKLTGGFGQFVLPEEIRPVEAVITMNDAPPKVEPDTAPAISDREVPYTGLIINAAGIDTKPSLVPIIADESGEVVYGPAFVSREFAVSRGMSGFAVSVAAARADKRVGNHPMVVKAIRSRSSETTDIVIASADAARLRSSVDHLNFLKACRVCIVMDPGVASKSES
jgi:hypothetical protein